MEPHWYCLDIQHVLETLDTSEQGLSDKEAQCRLKDQGLNEIAFKKTPAWQRFLYQFHDPMIYILLVTALVTGVLTTLGEPMLPETIVILSVVLFNAVLGYVQEGKAEGALEALRNMMVPVCLVEREGKQVQLPSKYLVPGDLVILESGDKIPADIRFIEQHNLSVDESSLTGESIPVEKQCDVLHGQNLVPGDQTNMGFSGTYVTQGSAKAVVVATGAQTVFGRIADMVKTTSTSLTPLQSKLREFVKTLIVAILIVGSLNFGYGLYLGYSSTYSFLGAISLVVSAIPAMLPALVTSILALSGTIMATRKALVRHLPAAETLGATSVICSDKTGTLTENKMTVTNLYCGGEHFQLTGESQHLQGDFLNSAGTKLEVDQKPALLRLLSCGFFCNNAQVTATSTSGDPTDIALKISGNKGGLFNDDFVRKVEIPFDSSAKYMAVLVEGQQGHFIFVKGAPEVVGQMCTTETNVQGYTTEFNNACAQDVAAGYASKALRTIGFAYKQVDLHQRDLTHEDLHGLTFAGLQGLIDPPKASAIEAVSTCSRAGIRTVMITGDHPETALAVAEKLGIQSQRAMTGAELNDISEGELRLIVEQISVFARVAPEHKKAIAKALQENGHVVAMTGDGINDAPALKQADIGVAMGVAGTEVAKEASDMVLADDNFATIVAGVEEGRHAWNNLQKAILYTLPTNAAQALLIMGAILIAAFIPLFSVRFVLEPVQILWINLLDSILLTMPLMMEKKEPGLLDKPPRSAQVRIINPLFIQRVLIIGLAIATPGFLIYYHFGAAAVVEGQLVNELLLTQAQTAAFWAILLAHIGYVISARSVHKSAFSLNFFSNPWLLGGIALSILIRFIPTVYPDAASLFRTADFPSEWWPYILLSILPSFVVIEADKLLRRNRSSSQR